MASPKILFALAAFAVVSLCSPTPGAAPTATINAGVIVGTTTSVSGSRATVVNKYLGVPFAASPTRFAPAVPPSPWSQPFDASKYGFVCPQQFNYPEKTRNVTMELLDNPPPPVGEHEDCLNLNIYVPKTPTSQKAVMVWIYGGSLQFGANSLPEYDGSNIAANQDVILIAINYRTNVFGFPGAPHLPLAKKNLGFLDQRVALEWIQRNVHAFGGDPGKVTIFGQSAGAASVDNLILTTPHKPPFRAAIEQSGSAATYSGLQRYKGPQAWNSLVSLVNCTHASDVIDCVRSVPQKAITSLIEHHELSFLPVGDNITLPVHPEAVRRSGKFARVPLLTGSTANDASIFVLGDSNTTKFLTSSLDLTATQAATYEKAYPIPSLYINSSFDQIVQIETDLSFQCISELIFNTTHSAHVPTWNYLYNATFPNIDSFPGVGVYHTSEISLIFGTYPKQNVTAQQDQFSKLMQTSWANFAKHPYLGPGWEAWPDVAVLGPVQGSQGDAVVSGGLIYDASVNASGKGRLDGHCELFLPIYEKLGIF